MPGFVARLKQRFDASPLGRFARKYAADQGDEQAALIAFHSLFSIFPLIGGLLALLGYFVREPETMASLVETVQKLFPAQIADLVSFIHETRQLSGLLSVLSLLGLLWSGSAIFGSMAQAFNRFYGVPDRGFLGQKLMAFSMIFVFLGLTLFSVLAAGLSTTLLTIGSGSLPFEVPRVGVLQSLLGYAVSVGSAFLLFLSVFRIVPNAPLRLRHVWPGALLAAVLFSLLNQLFPLYLRFFGGGFEAYKTLGLFLLLMTWFYFLARILVLGAELNAFRHPLPRTAVEQRTGRATAGATQLVPPAEPIGAPARRGLSRGRAGLALTWLLSLILAWMGRRRRPARQP